MKKIQLITILAMVALACLAPAANAQQYAPGEPWHCGLDNIDTTLTKCAPAPPPGMQLYITDIIAQSTTATGGEFMLRYGTGTNCGTGTVTLLPRAASAVRYGYPANTSAPTVISLQTPLAVPQGKDLCAVGIATQTLTIDILGITR